MGNFMTPTFIRAICGTALWVPIRHPRLLCSNCCAGAGNQDRTFISYFPAVHQDMFVISENLNRVVWQFTGTCKMLFSTSKEIQPEGIEVQVMFWNTS
jgi:hypothetical protein